MPVDEVMVHISAPTSKRDDDRYRRLALASQDFQVENVVNLYPTRRRDDKGDGHGTLRPNRSLALPEIPFDNGASSAESEPSQREILTHGSTRVSRPEIRISPLEISPKESRRVGVFDTYVEYIDDSLRAKAALESQLFTSSLKALGHSSPLDQSAALQAPRSSESLNYNEVTTSNSESQQQARHDPSSTPRDPALSNPEHTVEDHHERRLSPLAVSASPLRDLPATEDAAFPLPFLLEIIPPLPPTTMHRGPVSHITPAFHQLAKTLDLFSRFRPLHSVRNLRPLERGHWCIDTISWESGLQHDFWSYLGEFIKAGSAGWGVSCFRSIPVGEDGVIIEKISKDAPLGVVKIYCWGEIVGHVYLLAFVASKSKVKRIGAKWVDASEQVVVQMPLGSSVKASE